MTKKVLFKEKKLFQTSSDYFRYYSISRQFRRLFLDKSTRRNIISKIDQVKSYLEKVEQSLEGKKKRLDYIYERLEKKKEEGDTMEDETIIIDLTDDMYCGSMSVDEVSNFVCMLCYGIVMDPVKCVTCANLVCRKCVNP